MIQQKGREFLPQRRPTKRAQSHAWSVRPSDRRQVLRSRLLREVSHEGPLLARRFVRSRVRFLSAEEEEKLRSTIRSKPEWAEHEAELDLALHTGLRRGSMYLDLKWENVDLQARVAVIPRTKNGDQVVVPLNAPAMRALVSYEIRLAKP